MKPTVFIYSSHDRCEYIHKDWIVEPALKSWDNKTLLHLPWSQYARHSQEWDYGSFAHYFERFRQYGLDYDAFFWNDHLSHYDIEILFDKMSNVQVLVLGGGNPGLGMARFRQVGQMYNGDPDLFRRILFDRQERGLLTVGFSSGADQLAEYMWGAIDYQPDDPYGLGLCRNIAVSLHYEWGGGDYINYTAHRLPHCMSFGLPNDSGLGVDQGMLPSGNIWQIIWFVTDNSWDVPEEQWHIKTKAGVNIYHSYNDGRHWGFNGGDMMVRVMSQDNRWQDAWIINNQGQMFNYWTQEPSGYHNIEHILSCH